MQSFAWSEHALIAFPVLSSLPELQNISKVKVESLESFLHAEEKGIEKVLAEIELWARENLPHYESKPEALVFKADEDPATIKTRFMEDIRINPNSKMALHLQLLPEQQEERPSMDPLKIYTLSPMKKVIYVRLQEGEMVNPLKVVVGANDEPDYGMDIGLYVNNETEYGQRYEFGKQPFGNPNLSFGSKAPFHMIFMYESQIMESMAPQILKTYPEYRIKLYKTLSEFAFQTGHDYWGWRIMGWGLHYIGDLSQPYHTTTFPGVKTISILWKEITGKRKEATQLVSNRHLAIEKFQQKVMRAAYVMKDNDHPTFVALRSGESTPEFDDSSVKKIAKTSNSMADELDKFITRHLPPKLISDPTFEFSGSKESEQLLEIIEKKGEKGTEELTQQIQKMLAIFSSYAKSYVASIVKNHTHATN